jgi:hypothetical protein
MTFPGAAPSSKVVVVVVAVAAAEEIWQSAGERMTTSSAR